MKVLISAAETSSDAHGAELLKALRDGAPSGVSIDAFGIGGPRLEAAGLRVIFPARELLAMGFLEVLGRLPAIFGALAAVTRAAREEKPDVAVVIDYPDFHLRLARRLKRLGVPVVYYIPPKVWVWRKKRVETLRRLCARVLCIFPFEVEFFRAQKLEAARYVGNPLVEELPMETGREEARSRLGIEPGEKVLALMPGSRPSELRQHLWLFLDATQRAVALLRAKGVVGAKERVRVLVPFPETVAPEAGEARVEAWVRAARPGGMDVRPSRGNAGLCLLAADCGVIKSGTSTLEAALLRCPHVVVYRPNFVSCFIFNHLIRYRGPVGLVNLVSGSRVAPELICSGASVETIAESIDGLFSDSAAGVRMREALGGVRDKLLAKPSHRRPSAEAAAEVLQVAGCRP